MTRTAIVAALHDELASVLALMPDEQKAVVGGREFWVGHLHGQDVVAVLSGIGKVAAATTATLLIQHFGVSRIVFTGVAGGLGPGVKVGDVVLARAGSTPTVCSRCSSMPEQMVSLVSGVGATAESLVGCASAP